MSQDSAEDLLFDEDDGGDDYNFDDDEEEKLLQGDGTDFGEDKTPENELDETADVLNLIAEDEIDEDDGEGKSHSTSDRLKTDKFVNERPPISPIEFSKESDNLRGNNNTKKHNFPNPNNFQGNRVKGRFTKQQQKWKGRNNTVHINPRFTGNVEINGNARLKWQPPQNQNYPNYQGKNFNSFEPPPPRMKVWQNQHQNIPNNRFAPSQYFSTPDSVQHYTQPQMMGPGPMPPVQYNQVPSQFFQNREVFAQPAPMNVGFYQTPPPSLPVTNQPCYQAPVTHTNFCNNPVYNHPPPSYNTPPQYCPYNNPVVYNVPPPSHGDYNQTYPVTPPQPTAPPPVNYSSSFDNNRNNYEAPMQQNPKFIENRRVLLPGKQHQKKRFTNKNLDCSGNNKKKRVVESSNLHEIKPIEITAPIKVVEKPKEETTVKIDNLPDGLDEEYMRKIEEQKRLREEIFRKKELQRLKKATGVVSPTENNTISIKKITPPTTNFVKRQNTVNNLKNRNQNRNLVQINQQNIQIEVAAQNTSRVIQLKNKEEENVGLTKGFLSNRTVLTNDHSLINTPVVVVKNLSAGTGENKLQKMCQGIGEVQTLHLSREERQATIHFKSVASAHAFYKKYQRYMLDLSMIEVHLQTV